MAKRYPISRIKKHRSYMVDEVSDLLGCTEQTVYHWVKEGLPALIDQRPFLILGYHLKPFLQLRDAARKRSLGPSEFWCPSCKAPRDPTAGSIKMERSLGGRPVLKALCGACNCRVTRFVKAT